MHVFRVVDLGSKRAKSQTLVIATLNHLDKLDAALESRFQGKFFVDLPVHAERKAVAEIHYRRLGCENPDSAAKQTADYTDGFSSREIAETLIPSVARKTLRKPDACTIAKLATTMTPASKSQADELQRMQAERPVRSAARTIPKRRLTRRRCQHVGFRRTNFPTPPLPSGWILKGPDHDYRRT